MKTTPRNTAAYHRKEQPDKMLFRRFLKNKKAEGSGQPVHHMIIALLTSLPILVLFFYIVLGSSGIFASGPGQGTVVSFENFVEKLESVANLSKKIAIVETISLDDDQVIVVFDSRKPYVEDMCQLDEKFKKPPQCGSGICVCVCHEDEACENPYECKNIKNSKKWEIAGEANSDFAVNLGKTYSGDRAYTLIYGDCDGWGGPAIGVKDIVIEQEGSNLIRISDNACGNQRLGGKKGICTVKSQQQGRCGPGESPMTGSQYKCEEGYTCCI